MPNVAICVDEVAPGLRVVFGTLDVSKGTRWPDDGGEAWRVRHAVREYINGVPFERTLPMKFARSRDAESAARAIAKLADWTQPYRKLVQSLDLDNVRLVMLESMAW